MEFKQREDKMKRKHESEITELKQELFSLSVKVYTQNHYLLFWSDFLAALVFF